MSTKWTKEQEKILRDSLSADIPYAKISEMIGKSESCLNRKAQREGWKRIRRICPDCGKRRRQNHFNSKWCLPCALKRRKDPEPNLKDWQKEIIHSLDGKKDLFETARLAKTSKASVTRYRRKTGLHKKYYSYSNDLIKKVCEYYFVHGKRETQKKFKDVHLRSIIERHYSKLGFPPRCQPWRPDEIIMLAKMAGIISKSAQAKYFNRPRAKGGSIHAAWSKKFKLGGGSINGIKPTLANQICKKTAFINTECWTTRRTSDRSFRRRIMLWVDVDKYIKPNVPDHLKQAIKALADFQRWLHGRNVRANIKKLIKEIEYEQ